MQPVFRLPSICAGIPAFQEEWVHRATRAANCDHASYSRGSQHVRVAASAAQELRKRIRARMKIVIPLTLFIVFLILYLNFRGVSQALIVMASVPFAAMGSIWLMWAARFNTSIAVWVGMIALLGVAAETVSMMVVYLDEGFKEAKQAGRLRTYGDLIETAATSATQRVRPLLMTVGMNIVGLVPVMIDTGIGSDVAKRIAAPLWGGLISLTVLTLAGIPVLYVVWRGFQLRREFTVPEVTAEQT